MPTNLGGKYNFVVPTGTEAPDVVSDITRLAKAIDPAVKAAADASKAVRVDLTFRTDTVSTNFVPWDTNSVRFYRYGTLVVGQMRLRNTAAWSISAGVSNTTNQLFANVNIPTNGPAVPTTFDMLCATATPAIVAACVIDGGGMFIEHYYSRGGDAAATPMAANSIWDGFVIWCTKD